MLLSKRMKDIAGVRFGRLVAIEPIGIQESTNGVIWKCQCDCGNKTQVTTAVLRNGNTVSCGCFQKEQSRKAYLKLGDLPACKALWHDYRKSARKRNIEFTLTFEQFRQITQSKCFYCGIEPKRSFADNRFLTPYITNGIDRRDNTQGYTIDNSAACCDKCNYAKGTMTEMEFLQWINRVYLHQRNILSD